jgi:tetratricopeptide (TPR) repeat protein/transcriptional regulator with XRE-family HTH domain
MVDKSRGQGTFAEVLRRYRIAAGLSQEGLATRSGISVDTIGMLERGLRTWPRASTVSRLAAALHLSLPDRETMVAAAQRPVAAREVALPSTASIPRELPRAPSDFVGRDVELAYLRKLLTSGSTNLAPMICSIGGMGGVGKSALAIQIAHELTEDSIFPDGQLYINLQGASPGLPQLSPLAALGLMLRALGLASSAVPAEVNEAAARFRSLSATRRLLVLLDNARSAEQVRPLLPGSPTCAVVVTSREVLTSLEGAKVLHVDVLPEQHAFDLLARVAGQDRLVGGSEVAGEVVHWCGRLPLAIRIAGARLAARPGWPVRELALQLADSTRRMGSLRTGDLAVTACFDVSLQSLLESGEQLDRAAAAAFCLFSLPNGPHFGIAAAARVIDRSEAAAEAVADRLVNAKLLESPRPGHYQFHDLLKLYARQAAPLHHPDADRTAALARVLAFYVATAWNTLRVLRPGDLRSERADPRWSAGGLEFEDPPSAVAWLESERENLVAAVEQAAGEPTLAAELPGQLARALFGFFEVCGHWHDWMRVNETAIGVARRIGDRAGEAVGLNDLGGAHVRLGRYSEAIACLEESISIFQEVGDRRGESGALVNLGAALSGPHRYADALPHQRRSLTISRQLDDRQGQARALFNLGFLLGRLSRNEEAIACLKDAADIYRDLGSRLGQAQCLNSLGAAYRRLGRDELALVHQVESLGLFRELGSRLGQAHCLDDIGVLHTREGSHLEAITCLRQGLALFRELGDRQGQALVLRDLGDAYRAAGSDRRAGAAWREGLAISKALQIPEEREIRRRLSGLDAAAESNGGDDDAAEDPDDDS